MKNIKILSQLNITNGQLVANNQSVFLQQGSLDGACGPYCLFMALLILDVIGYDDAISLWKIKRSTKLGKLIKAMEIHKQLFQAGTYVEDLKEMIEVSFKNQIEVKTNKEGGKKTIQFILQQLKNQNPVIVGVKNKTIAHWMLAIGFEDYNNEITKILFLDPSEKEPISYFNSAINIKDTVYGYPYKWETLENTYVKFEDAVSINIQ